MSEVEKARRGRGGREEESKGRASQGENRAEKRNRGGIQEQQKGLALLGRFFNLSSREFSVRCGSEASEFCPRCLEASEEAEVLPGSFK